MQTEEFVNEVARAAEAGRTQTTQAPAEIAQDELFKQVAGPGRAGSR